MERKLPILDILGTEYEIDLHAGKFLPLNAPPSAREIDISSMLTQEDYWLSAYYDKLSRNLVKIPRDPKDPSEVPGGVDLVVFIIPPPVQLDTVAYAEMEGIDIATLDYVQRKDRHVAEILPFEETTLYYKLQELHDPLAWMGTKVNNDDRAIDHLDNAARPKELQGTVLDDTPFFDGGLPDGPVEMGDQSNAITENMEKTNMNNNNQSIDNNVEPMTARNLPRVMFGGDVFLVDVLKEEFRQSDNQRNIISFDMMVREGDGYLVIYDPLVKNVPGPDRYQHPDIQTVEVPPLGLMDLEGMAIRYGRDIEAIRGKSDYEIIVDQKVLADRLAGILPIVDIAGDLFYVDVRLGELRLKDDFSHNGIHFSQLEPHPLIAPQTLRFFYDKETKQAVRYDADELMEIPKNVTAFEIPIMEKLDPVRIATMYGLDMQDFLMKVPPQARFEAKVLPWEQTGLPRIIAENQQRMRTEKFLEAHRSKKNVPKRKGRSL